MRHEWYLHLLLVQREVGSLGGQLATPREAKHVLKFGIPGHAVGILILRQQGLGLHAVHMHTVAVIHHSQLAFAAAQIQTPEQHTAALMPFQASDCLQLDLF